MDESAGALAEFADAPAIYGAGLISVRALEARPEPALPSLLDPRIVRVELTRLRRSGTGVPHRAGPSRERPRSAHDGRRPA